MGAFATRLSRMQCSTRPKTVVFNHMSTSSLLIVPEEEGSGRWLVGIRIASGTSPDENAATEPKRIPVGYPLGGTERHERSGDHPDACSSTFALTGSRGGPGNPSARSLLHRNASSERLSLAPSR